MEVLGTHIKRIDVEGPSPVTTIEQEQIKQSGAESIGDVLRDDALNIFGSRREKSGGNFWSESSVELRGLGQARTLVLLNGKRLPRGGNWSVDLNIIPIAAVERVEILRDGASAIYGTDALGGVVNIITKKNFDGSAATIKALVPQDPGGQSKTLSYYQGVQLDKTQISFMLNFRDTDTVHWNQRKDILDTSKAYTDGGMPGNYVDARGYDKAFPNCPESNIVDSKCVDRYWEDSILQPSIQTLSFVSNFTHRLTDDLEVFGRAIVSRKNSEYQWGPVQPKNFFKVSKAAAVKMVEGLQINGVDYSTIFDAARSDRPITLKFAVEEAGPQKREGVADLFGLGLGVKGPIWDDFEWEVFVAADRTQQRDTQTNGAIKKSELIAKMEAGTYNPFKEYGERGAIDDIEFKPWAEVESGSREVNAKISGPLFELPAGTVQGAAGVIGVNEYFNADRDPQLNEKEADGTDFDGADFTGFTGTGNRLVTSAYAEVSVPVIERMELQLAARFDEYSDFGNTLNPKIGWRYAPVSWAYLRFSGGRGFRAPTLDELYRDEYPQFVTFTDAKTGSSMRMYIKGGGNKDLSPERSEAISYGLGLEPFAFMSVTADYWRMNLIDPISFSAMASLTQAEANGYDVSRFATITRDPITKDILDVVAPYQNMGRKEVAGYDLTSVLTQKTNGFGTFRLRSNHSVMLKYKTKDWPLDELTDRKGYGGSPRWRNNSSLGWSFDEYYASLSANTTAAQKSDPNRQNWVNYYTEYSSYLKYRAPWKGELSFGIVNLDNRKPPQNDRQPDINARLYSLLGRRFNLEYTQNF
ncbi:MAG TPA: TonB-dependent receptor [Oligoflexus sp.]|uniref:TonB-dependent receptor plug domain-containing protein n=1 Tax=Oligoflexus sp. TaxID=1971216 RepID=UPI002D7F9633|nr:TonB-dependent receptor [Oligoflexus sp.]HET9238094.1 TonB-dependent receptor [Oligoflexus sp.]